MMEYNYSYKIYFGIMFQGSEIHEIQIFSILQYRNNLVLFPNPTKGIFNIKTNQKIEKAKIYDISGKIIQNLFPLNSKIDVSKLEDGIYFIEILSDGKIQRKKFVLKK